MSIPLAAAGYSPLKSFLYVENLACLFLIYLFQSLTSLNEFRKIRRDTGRRDIGLRIQVFFNVFIFSEKNNLQNC